MLLEGVCGGGYGGGLGLRKMESESVIGGRLWRGGGGSRRLQWLWRMFCRRWVVFGTRLLVVLREVMENGGRNGAKVHAAAV